MIVLSALLIAGAGAIVICALDRDRPSPLWLLLPVGVHGLLLIPFWLNPAGSLDVGNPPLLGTLWTFANGMESPVVLVAFAGTVYLLLRHPPSQSERNARLLGLSLALLALSRLDHVLFAAGPLLYLWALAWQTRDPKLRRRAWSATVTSLLPILTYCLLSRLWCGMWLPVSGRIKSTFPLIDLSNLVKTWETLRHPLSQPWWRTYREAQILFPVVVSLIFLAWLGRRSRRPSLAALGALDAPDRGLVLLLPGVVLLAVYNEFYVPLPEQGHWYFPASILMMSIISLRMIEVSRLGEWLRGNGRAALACALGCLVVLGVLFIGFHRRFGINESIATVYYDIAPIVRQHYGGEHPRLVELADGIIAYSTRYPTIAGKPYPIDREYMQAIRSNRHQELWLARGHDRLATVGYVRPNGLHLGSPSHIVASRLGGDARRYDHKIELISGDFIIVRLTPRESSGSAEPSTPAAGSR